MVSSIVPDLCKLDIKLFYFIFLFYIKLLAVYIHVEEAFDKNIELLRINNKSVQEIYFNEEPIE